MVVESSCVTHTRADTTHRLLLSTVTRRQRYQTIMYAIWKKPSGGFWTCRVRRCGLSANPVKILSRVLKRKTKETLPDAIVPVDYPKDSRPNYGFPPSQERKVEIRERP